MLRPRPSFLVQRGAGVLDHADAQVELVGDLLVRGGGGECVAALRRAADRARSTRALRVGQGGRRTMSSGTTVVERCRPCSRLAEHDARLSEAERVARPAAGAGGRGGLVQERAVLRREALVAEASPSSPKRLRARRAGGRPRASHSSVMLFVFRRPTVAGRPRAAARRCAAGPRRPGIEQERDAPRSGHRPSPGARRVSSCDGAVGEPPIDLSARLR